VRDGLSGAIRLDTETGLAPVSSLGVVPVDAMSVSCSHYRVVVFLVVSSSDDRKRQECAYRGRSVPDGVAGPQANPLRDGAVLLLRARKLLLGAERLLGL
jgi:hypothetical protein